MKLTKSGDMVKPNETDDVVTLDEEKSVAMHKDSLKVLVEMMEYIVKYHAQVTEKIMRSKFGKDYNLFAIYCLGDPSRAYVHKQDTKHFQITQDGFRKLQDLRKTLSDEKRSEIMNRASILLMIFVGLQAIFSLINLFFS